jgi:hypothetical protein
LIKNYLKFVLLPRGEVFNEDIKPPTSLAKELAHPLYRVGAQGYLQVAQDLGGGGVQFPGSLGSMRVKEKAELAQVNFWWVLK